MHSSKRLRLETTPENLFGRIMDLFCPIGIGQSGVIAGPKQSGKMLVMENIANAVRINHPDTVIFIVLVDMGQEEASTLRRAMKGSIVFAISDETQGLSQLNSAEFVLKWAQKLMECKSNVLIFLVMPALPCTMVKRFVQAAKCSEGGGALTVLVVAPDTSPRHDEQWQKLCNINILMTTDVLKAGIFPAVNIHLSGNSEEKELFSREDTSRILVLRKVLEPLSAGEAAKLLGSKMLTTRSNNEFLANMSSV